jgi:quercetin dioxygenase-like cupin family protein
MTGGDDALDVGRLGRSLSSSFSRRIVELPPGAHLDHEDASWQTAIVFLTAGELNIECPGGECHCFRAGDVLTLAHLPIRRAHNCGATPTRLLAIWRRTSPVTLGPTDRHTKKDHE